MAVTVPSAAPGGGDTARSESGRGSPSRTAEIARAPSLGASSRRSVDPPACLPVCSRRRPGWGRGICSLAGTIYLAWFTNPLTSVLGAISLVSYIFIYTPLKRLTWWNTAVGAIPGALPPLMGWTAARGALEPGGWALFAILAFWQMPHFFAIAWMYRDEYAKAGFKMLPSVDPGGSRTAQQAVSHNIGLLLVSLSPFVLRMAGKIYLGAAILLGVYYLWCAIQFGRKLDHASAKKLFFASIIYLPLLLIFLVADKL